MWEFASYGFVVVAIQHRDGSGPELLSTCPEKRTGPKNEKVEDSLEDSEKGYFRMDYVFPQRNPRDTSPGNESGINSELRGAQIQLRLAEIEEAYHSISVTHDGKGKSIAAANLRTKSPGRKGGSSRGLDGIDWASWKDRFHLHQVTMLGHSFGGATVIY